MADYLLVTSITYQDENVTEEEKMSKENVPDKTILSPSLDENVTETVRMSQTEQKYLF